jgi:glutathione S-transferase
MQITLHYAPIACSLVPYVALTEAGADFEVKLVNFFKGEHMSADYLQLNPKHKVPVLVVDDQPLTENVAILQWIARNFEDAQLLPAGMDEFRAISLMSWCASGIHPTLTPNVMPQRYCDLPGSEDAVKKCAHRVMHENFAIAESLLNGRDWFFDHLTIPDIYFFWCLRRAKQFEIDVSAYPNCNAHFDRISKRPSVIDLLEFESDALATFAPK